MDLINRALGRSGAARTRRRSRQARQRQEENQSCAARRRRARRIHLGVLDELLNDERIEIGACPAPRPAPSMP